MDRLPDQVILEQLLTLPFEDLQSVCQLDKRMAKICDRHEHQIYSQLIKRDFPGIPVSTKDTYLLVKTLKRLGHDLFNPQHHFQLLWETSNSPHLLKLLVHFGADINSRFTVSRDTLLLHAIRQREPERVLNILSNNPNPNLENEFDTPLLLMAKDNTFSGPHFQALFRLQPNLNDTATSVETFRKDVLCPN